jgi:hypothetical protein
MSFKVQESHTPGQSVHFHFDRGREGVEIAAESLVGQSMNGPGCLLTRPLKTAQEVDDAIGAQEGTRRAARDRC